MANATARDVRAGYELYREHDGSLSRTELNKAIFVQGFNTVSQRTFLHYGRLHLAGYDRYVPINRFELARNLDISHGISALARYSYRNVDIEAVLAFDKVPAPLECRAKQIGDVGVLMELPMTDDLAQLRGLRPKPGDAVSVRFAGADRLVRGHVVDSDFGGLPALLELEYDEVTPLVGLLGGAESASSLMRFTLRGEYGDGLDAELASRQFHYLLQALESLRTLVNALHEPRAGDYAAPARLRSLSIASPTEALIELGSDVARLIPWAVLWQIVSKVSQIPEKRKAWHEGTLIKRQADREAAADIRSAEQDIDDLRTRLVRAIGDRFANERSLGKDEIRELHLRIERDLLPYLVLLAQSKLNEIESQASDDDGNDE